MDHYKDRLDSIVSELFSSYALTVQNPGVLLSGGIDSSLIAWYVSRYFSSYTVFSMGTEMTKDMPYVKIMCSFLSVPFIWVDLQSKDIDTAVPVVKKLLILHEVEPTLMQLSLATGYFLVFKRAQEIGITAIFTGQGPDVLFGGYHKYKLVSNINAEIQRDLALLETDKKRDTAMAKYFGITLINPFLEQKVIEFALSVPDQLKVKNGIEKYLLRKLAKCKGLPDSIVNRPKKAFQYSTGIQKAIRRYTSRV